MRTWSLALFDAHRNLEQSAEVAKVKTAIDNKIQLVAADMLKLKKQLDSRDDRDMPGKVLTLVNELTRLTSLLDSPADLVSQLSPSLTPLIGQVVNSSIASYNSEMRVKHANLQEKVEDVDQRLGLKIATLEVRKSRTFSFVADVARVHHRTSLTIRWCVASSKSLLR
jgi:hypothetical protein